MRVSRGTVKSATSRGSQPSPGCSRRNHERRRPRPHRDLGKDRPGARHPRARPDCRPAAPAGGRTTAAPRARRLGAWAAPVIAAAVVVALAIALVTVRQVQNEPSVPPSAPAVSSAGQTIPEYYAALTGLGDASAAITKPSSVVVGNDRTGGVLAVIPPPAHQTFAGVTAAANDRTFLVEAWPYPYPIGAGVGKANPVAWYLLRVAPGKCPSRHAHQRAHPRAARVDVPERPRVVARR